MRALAAFRDRHGAGQLRFLGPSSAAERRGLLDLADRLGIAGDVKVDGRVPDVDLEAAYSSATALLTTSRVEGFGLPAVEAVIRGVPVIAVENAATREILAGVANLVPPDPDALAVAMGSPWSPDAPTRTALRDRFSPRAGGEALWAAYALWLD